MSYEEYFDEIQESKLIEQEKGRKVVYIKSSEKEYILKSHEINGFQKVFKSSFHLKNWKGYPELLGEFHNIKKARLLIDNIPKLIKYTVKRNKFGLVKKQYLITEFLNGCFTSENLLKNNSINKAVFFEKLALTFRKNLDLGFMHLDPHPGNIMLDMDINNLWFIDLECCDFNIFNKDIACGFLCGHFYYYFAHRFIGKEEYHQLVMNYMVPVMKIENYNLYNNIYKLYRDQGIKRKDRFSHFHLKSRNDQLVNQFS